MITPQQRRRLRLPQKSLHRLGMPEPRGQKELHRIKLPEVDVAYRNDKPHAALTQHPLDTVFVKQNVSDNNRCVHL